jgi:hypothetical protein
LLSQQLDHNEQLFKPARLCLTQRCNCTSVEKVKAVRTTMNPIKRFAALTTFE